METPGNLIDLERPVSGLSKDLPAHHVFAAHSHRRAQLIYSSHGIALVATPEKAWAVPPQQAVWIPPNVLHEVTARDALALRTLYFEPRIVRRLSKECSVVDVSPLLRELILRALAPPSEQTNVARNRIERLIVDEMTIAKVSPFSLPFPEVRRLRAIVDQLLADPGDDRSFDELCQSSGGSSRTLSRLFIQHTGMTFGKWRERLRFIRALELLVDGQSVGTIAYLLGYQHPSAFINMFKRQIGVSPARYLRINSVCGGMTAKVGAGKHSPGASSVMAASTSVLNSSGHMKLV